MADDWLHRDTSIDVNISSVVDFALKLGTLGENFSTSLTEGVAPVSRTPAVFGGGGIQEGTYFGKLNTKNQEAATKMIAEALLCLKALGTAAGAVAIEYTFGDAESSATVDDVYDAFTPTAAATPATTPATTGDPLAPPPPPADNHRDPDRNAPAPPRDASRVIAPGTPGEYTIEADDEAMRDCTPEIPRPEH